MVEAIKGPSKKNVEEPVSPVDFEPVAKVLEAFLTGRPLSEPASSRVNDYCEKKGTTPTQIIIDNLGK